MEKLCRLLDVPTNHLTTIENLILEAELFTRICEELQRVVNQESKNYYFLIKRSIEEDIMLETTLLQFVINDILLTEEYSLAGIAYYTQIPEEVICDVASGKNASPSLQLSRKLIELHRAVKPNLYKAVVKKIVGEYFTIM
jgi:hypothetical protein